MTAMRSSAACILLSALLLLAACDGDKPAKPPETPSARPATQPDVAAAYPADWQANWPQFRGPTGDGRADPSADPPLKLDLARQLRFKTPLPFKGNSSPIVWGDRVYLTGEGERIAAFDRTTGRLLWNTQLAPPPPLFDEDEGDEPKPDVSDTGMAAPTACTDGQRVYAFFGSGVIGAVDLAGEQVWADRLVERVKSDFGLASSPIFFRGNVIQVVDMGRDSRDKLSFILALRGRDGVQVWRQPRPVAQGWATPLVALTPTGIDLITCGNPWAIGYDPADGRERWRAGELTGEVAASPVVAGDLVIALSGESGSIQAFRLGGMGDVSESNRQWTSDADVPDVASPVIDGRQIIELTARGVVTCLGVADGRLLWERELPQNVWASPVLIGNRVVCVDTSGELFVLAADRKGEILARAALKEQVYASPAVVGDSIYIRTARHLIRLAEPPAATQPDSTASQPDAAATRPDPAGEVGG